jgi:hypothetical protein
MLIIEKIIKKRISDKIIFEKRNNRIQFFFDNKKHFISIEKIDLDCFLCFIDKEFLRELNYLLGLDRSTISQIIMDWFLREMNITKIQDLNDKLKFSI